MVKLLDPKVYWVDTEGVAITLVPSPRKFHEEYPNFGVVVLLQVNVDMFYYTIFIFSYLAIPTLPKLNNLH